MEQYIKHFEKVAEIMRKFQQLNNITNKCVSNVQYLYDSIKFSNIQNNIKNIDVKTKPVFVCSYDSDTETFICVVHLIIVLIDKTEKEIIIDSSYDTFSLKNKTYIDNIKDLVNMFMDKNNSILKKCIKEFLNFIKATELINNGKFALSSGDIGHQLYNKQADYVDKILKKM